MLTVRAQPWPQAENAASIRVGQQFRAVGGDGAVFRVVAVIRPSGGVAHARIRPAGRRSGAALVSCAALGDSRAFVPLADSRPPLISPDAHSHSAWPAPDGTAAQFRRIANGQA